MLGLSSPTFDPKTVNVNDPDPWLAMYLDSSNWVDPKAKKALLRGNSSYCRRFIYPLVMPFARLAVALIKVFRVLSPRWPRSIKGLHYALYWLMRLFVSKDANELILRHFNIGTENLQFIAQNAEVEIHSTIELRPKNLEDLIDNTFLIHDLNLYNFIIELNEKLKEQDRLFLEPPETLDFSAISVDGEFGIEALPDRWHNFLDLQTAIELYIPIYALLLTDNDFWRASNSLQLDQSVALYVAKLLGKPEIASLVNNRHPMVPDFILSAGYRLMLHGHDAEILHGLLRRMSTKVLSTGS